MRYALALVALVSLLQSPSAPAPPAPTLRLANGRIEAQLHAPDARAGYYRGTRFDWSGVIASLRWRGHDYFGLWFEKYDPLLHDAITGPVEEFLTGESSLGYDEAKPGELFVRIGVGAVRRADDKPYQRFNTYEIVDGGKWSVTPAAGAAAGDTITFEHALGDTNGYAYVYRKRVRLKGDTLVLEHELRNTGRKPIATSVYDHNFFTIDGPTTGPDVEVKFPFEPRPRQSFNGLASVRGRDIVFAREFKNGETVYSEIDGAGRSARDYDFRIENVRTHAGVRIRGDRPLAKLVFWSNWKTSCPEPYIGLNVAPGQSATWKIEYEFYEKR